jgi:uncharacterized protein YeaO (DUF488 family)
MSTGRIKTRRWNDPVEDDDGFRLLVTRFRPRGVRKDAESWDDWWPRLAPSPDLVAEFHGKNGPPLPWPEYRVRYLDQMRGEGVAIRTLAWRVAGGETVTLLCSSACVDPERCHRSLLEELVDASVKSRG